jgi:uncharacterized membrane protein YgcG
VHYRNYTDTAQFDRCAVCLLIKYMKKWMITLMTVMSLSSAFACLTCGGGSTTGGSTTGGSTTGGSTTGGGSTIGTCTTVCK